MSAVPAIPVEVVWTVTASSQSASVTPATPLLVSVAQVHLGLRGRTGDMHSGIPMLVQQALTAAEQAEASAARVDLGALDQAVQNAQESANEANDAKLAAQAAAADAENMVPKFATGVPLPVGNIGPIWHDDYASIMTWRTIGAYTGYASVNLGQVASFDSETAPAGWLKMSGQTLSAAYQALNEFRGSSTLRDPRGYGIRAWDDGRGIDTGRVLGSTQQDGIKASTFNINRLGNIGGSVSAVFSATGEVTLTPNVGATAGQNFGLISGTDQKDRINIGSATETRMKNIAFLFCIKF